MSTSRSGLPPFLPCVLLSDVEICGQIFHTHPGDFSPTTAGASSGVHVIIDSKLNLEAVPSYVTMHMAFKRPRKGRVILSLFT